MRFLLAAIVGAATFTLPMALVAVFSPASFLEVALYANPLNVCTLFVFAIVSFHWRLSSRTRHALPSHRKAVWLVVAFCLVWSALAPLVIRVIDRQVYVAAFHQLVFMFVFDALLSVLAVYYLYWIPRGLSHLLRITIQ